MVIKIYFAHNVQWRLLYSARMQVIIIKSYCSEVRSELVPVDVVSVVEASSSVRIFFCSFPDTELLSAG